MKNILNYREFRINEGFLGNIINFFKNFFKKVAADLLKLENDPNKIKEYLVANVIPSIFKQETDNFLKTASKKESFIFEQDNPIDTSQNLPPKQDNKNQTTPNDKPSINTDLDEKAFGLIDALLNKDSGVLGKQGIGMLFNDKSLQGEDMKPKRLTVEYIINNVRNSLAKSLKYDQKRNIERKDDKFIDTNYLPTFKEALSKGNNPETIVKWIETNIRDVMINNIKAIKEDDIRAYLQKSGVTSSDYKVGDTVKYKMNGFVEGTDPKEQQDKVGELPIVKIEGDNYTFKDKKGAEFVKTKDKILGKSEGNEQDGQIVDDIKTKLGKIKDDRTKMAAIDKVVNLINQPGGIDKINKL